MALSVSVVVITYARPAFVAECLARLHELAEPALEVIVIDASPDDRTRTLVVTDFPAVVYLRHDLGPGTMPESRALGLARARGDVVAFIDDDAYVDQQWLAELVAPYAASDVAAVGGRAVNGIPGEDTHGLGQIGRFLPDGQLTGNFAADPGRVIEVDHLLGANMSFRRSTLLAIGGIRGGYPGTCLCEESDISLRIRAAGYRLVFNPAAVVRHVAAPYQSGGQRFDRRYLYYARRNHLMLLARVFGFTDPLVRRYVVTALRDQRRYVREAVGRLRNDPGASAWRRVTSPLVLMTRAVVELAGLAAGVPAGIRGRRADRTAGVGTP